MICLLVLVDPKAGVESLAAYAHSIAASVPARIVVLPLPGSTAAPAAPLTLGADVAQRFCLADSAVPVQLAQWEPGFSFSDALHRALEKHRASAVVLVNPRLTRSVAAQPELFPAVSLLLQPPCAVLLHPGGGSAAAPRRAVVAVDGEPAGPIWAAATGRLLLRAWRASIRVVRLRRLRPVGHTTGTAVTPSEYWHNLTAGLPSEPMQVLDTAPGAIPEQLLAIAGQCSADLLLLLLRGRDRAHHPFKRRDTILTLLGSPVPVLLLPAE
ncbi:hypothetical protein [Hymenobacter latericus]|uniref:hypothetical protein n=1 Tax=Hymenobacter sp. YIM 151858-1 TaxID=2987688 RepID=UPI0022271EFA|nr:hypothetical protein [Hymenobacter sp. YIM 151858-1]UYZ61165.1 hypothetical protein OIS50_19540 [Hymenobacter sp. YIM 151858-1]